MINQIHNVSVDDLFLDIRKYVNIFLEDGIVFLKNIHATTQEQWDITCAFGELIGFLPNISSIGQDPRSPFYCLENEDHKNTFDRHVNGPVDISSDDNIFIEWHIENIHQNNPQIAASWNMVKFKCSPTSGTTGFVNMKKIISLLPNEWVEFLNKVKIKSMIETNEHGVILDVQDKKNLKDRPIIVEHYKTGVPVLRMGFYKNENMLSSVDNLSPTQDQLEMFLEIEKYISDQVINESTNQDWISWDEGDLVLVDLFTMAHAVKGGFNLGERIFSRVWCYKEEPTN